METFKAENERAQGGEVVTLQHSYIASPLIWQGCFAFLFPFKMCLLPHIYKLNLKCDLLDPCSDEYLIITVMCIRLFGFYLHIL